MSRPYIVVPMPDARPIYVCADWPMTPSQWDHLIHVLTTMRPGLVEPEEAEQ